VCTDLHGTTENRDLPSRDGGFQQSFRERMRGFHDLLGQKPFYLLVLLGWSSISIASLMMQSMYLGLVARMVVWCSWMQCKLIMCSATAALSECSRQMSLVLLQPGVNCTVSLPNVDLAALTGDAVCSWCPQSQVILDQPKET
jgi:hypothetical protein